MMHKLSLFFFRLFYSCTFVLFPQILQLTIFPISRKIRSYLALVDLLEEILGELGAQVGDKEELHDLRGEEQAHHTC